MFGFPQVLNDMGAFNMGAPLHEDNSMMFPLSIGRRTFYTIRDGNWTDTTIWATLDGAAPGLPTANDDVYIRNNILFNIGNVTVFCNNLFIINYGLLRFSGGNQMFNILGNIKVSGNSILDLSGLSSQFGAFNLYGQENIIPKSQFIGGGVFGYLGKRTQLILDLDYLNLTIGLWDEYSDIKYLTSDLSVNNLSIYGSFLSPHDVLDCLNYNLVVNGVASMQSRLMKSGEGKITFIGAVNQLRLNLTSNCEVEFRGGFSLGNTNDNTTRTGNGLFRFTTNNQTISGGNSIVNFSNNFLIDNVTLTVESGCNLILLNTINSTTSSSQLINRGTITFATQNAAENSMTTGIFDTTTNANTVQYSGNYSATIPSRFPNFHNLTIGGTGTKTLSTNTVLNGSLTLSGINANLNLSSYNFSVGTTTTLNNSTTLQKTGAGNVIFNGNVSVGDYSTLNISNAIYVELKGNLTSTHAAIVNFGTNTVNITGNSTLNIGGNVCTMTSILISSGVTVINTSSNGISTSNINGLGSSSIFDNRGILYLTNSDFSGFMTTGVFIYDVNPNSFIYFAGVGDYYIPFTNFQGFGLAASGTKTLSGNTTCTTFIIGISITNAKLQLSNFDFSVTGQTTLNQGSGNAILKSSTGSVKFGYIFNRDWTAINFSGSSCNVEFTNGIGSIGTGYGSAINLSECNVLFSTTNQNIINNNTTTWNLGNVIIANDLTISINSISISNIIFETLNGSNSNSKLLQLASSLITYNGPSTPMSTGVLDTSTNLNTFIYGNGNQNIKGGTYRNLTLNGGGTKTLQGNVSVQNTYTLTSPATLNNNGFTLTNP